MERYDYVVIKATVSKYDKIFNFQEDMGRVLYNGKFGFINKEGVEVISPQYDNATDFKEGLAIVKKNQKMLAINKQNKIVTQEYDFISPFSKGYAIIRQNNKYGIINQNGEEVIQALYDAIDYPSNDLIYVQDADIHKYINLNNQVVITLPKNIKQASSFNNGLARIVTEDYKFGFIDKTGKIVIDTIYNNASNFYNNLANVWVKEEGSTVIYQNGQELFPRTNNFSITGDISKKGIFIANFGFEKNGLVDRFGNFITKKFYSNIYFESDGLIRVKDVDHKYGFINLEGMEVIPSRLENANDFKEGLALIEDRENHKYGYINKQGKIVIPCIYDKADDFSNGMATVMLDGIEFYIDKNNKPLQFNETKQKIIEVKAPNKIPTYVQDFNCERDFMAYKTKLIVSDDWEPQVVVTRNINDYENHLNKVITKQIIIEKSMQDLGNKKILTK